MYLLQLQNKYKEERLIVNSLQDESSKTKNNLQHELLSQRQQLELHIAHMNEQHQQVTKFFYLLFLIFFNFMNIVCAATKDSIKELSNKKMQFSNYLNIE